MTIKLWIIIFIIIHCLPWWATGENCVFACGFNLSRSQKGGEYQYLSTQRIPLEMVLKYVTQLQVK